MRSRRFSTANKKYLTYLKSKEWRAKRDRVIERCGNVCEHCGHYPVAEIHHLTYDRVFREELDDLQGLCVYCHTFMHHKWADDGEAEYERDVRRREELDRLVAPARAEVARFEDRPEAYRRFTPDSFATHRELVTLLRQNPRIILTNHECDIKDVRYAKRKHESAVTFRVCWSRDGDSGWTRVKSAEDLLYPGKLVLDAERGLWVKIDDVRWFVRRYGVNS